GVRKGRKRGRRRGRPHERPARDVCNHGVAPWSGTPPQKPAAPASFRFCPRNAEGIIAAFQFAELQHVRGQLKDKATLFPLGDVSARTKGYLAVEFQCPLLGVKGHSAAEFQCLLSEVKRTFLKLTSVVDPTHVGASTLNCQFPGAVKTP